MAATSGGVKPDWYEDPTGRHQYRYWDGTAWTDHVADAGVPGVDRLATRRTITGKESPKVLIEALQDADVEVQKSAARALGGRGGAAAVQPLLACLESENANLRTYVMQALVETEAAESVLVAALGEPEHRSPDATLDALTDAIRFGLLKGSPRCNRVLRLAFKRSWQSPKSLALLGLLMESGDPVGLQLSMAVNADDSAAVERIVRSF